MVGLNAGYGIYMGTSAVVPPVPKAPSIYSLTIGPTSAVVGQKVQASVGYTGHPRGDVTWQWYAGGVPIPGANSAEYTPVEAIPDLTVAVSIVNPTGTDNRTSAPIEVLEAEQGLVYVISSNGDRVLSSSLAEVTTLQFGVAA